MRHRKSGVKLNRTTSHRQAMFRNMVTSLFKYDRIKTTDAKAKELRRWADHIVTLAKRGDLHARRMAMSIVREKDVVHKIFNEAADRFGSINGGYTRIVKIGRRSGDAAAMTLVELVSSDAAKPQTAKAKTDDKPASAEPKKTETEVSVVESTEPAAADGPAESVDGEAQKVDNAPDTPSTDNTSENDSTSTSDSAETDK